MTAIEPGLFAEPQRVDPPTDGPWAVGPAPQRWHYMFLGEDSEWLMFYGHVPSDELSDAVVMAGADDDDWCDYTRWTYATTHDMCHYHLTWVDGCEYCLILREGGGPLVTLTARADPDDAEKSTPGWFPVTVVDLEA